MGRKRHTEMQSWEKEPLVLEWKKTVKKRTFRGYRYSFQKWLDWIRKDLDRPNLTVTEIAEMKQKQILSKDRRERRFFETKLLQYLRELTEQTDLTESGVLNRGKSPMAFFSNAVQIPLHFRRGELRRVIKQAKGRTPSIPIPSNEEIRAIYRRASIWLRPAILLSYQSGFDGNDISKMKIEEVFHNGKFPKGITKHHFVPYKRHKNGERQYTFISTECLHDLKICLKEREMPKKGYLVTSVHRRQFSSTMLNQEFQRKAKKIVGKEFVFKTLRKRFKIEMNKAGIKDPEIKKVLIGHRIGVEGNYSMWKDYPGPLREAYEKMWSSVSIDGGMQARIQEDEILSKIAKQDEMIEKQNKRMENLDTELSRTSEALNLLFSVLPSDLKEEYQKKMLKHFGDRFPTET